MAVAIRKSEDFIPPDNWGAIKLCWSRLRDAEQLRADIGNVLYRVGRLDDAYCLWNTLLPSLLGTADEPLPWCDHDRDIAGGYASSRGPRKIPFFVNPSNPDVSQLFDWMMSELSLNRASAERVCRNRDWR